MGNRTRRAESTRSESKRSDHMTLVGRPAPEFQMPCTVTTMHPERETRLSEYRGSWLILLFYPRDFSLVCPTELTAIGERIAEFETHGCRVLAVSTDPVATHERWIATPRDRGGLGGVSPPLASDESGDVSSAYGVYLEHQHVALRGLFIIDTNGVVQYESVHNLNVGRSSDEVVRILEALQTGGMCPEDWCAGCPTLDPIAACFRCPGGYRFAGGSQHRVRVEGESCTTDLIMFEISWQVKNAPSQVETTIFFLLACFLPKTVAVRSLSVAPSSRSRSIDTKTDPAPDASRTRIDRSRPNTAPSHESSCDLRTRTARRSVDSDPASVLQPPLTHRILFACPPAPCTRTPSRDE